MYHILIKSLTVCERQVNRLLPSLPTQRLLRTLEVLYSDGDLREEDF
jgi:hypothetical protein